MEIQIRAEKRAECEEYKRMKEAEEQAEFDFKPRINRDKSSERAVEDLYKWKEQLDKKKEDLRKARHTEMGKSTEKNSGSFRNGRSTQQQTKKPPRSISTLNSNPKQTTERLLEYSHKYEKKRKEREKKLYGGLFQPKTTVYVKRSAALSVELYPKSAYIVCQYHGKGHSKSKSPRSLKTNSKPERPQTPEPEQKEREFKADNKQSIVELFNRHITDPGTQTSTTYFNNLSNVESFKDYSRFHNDEASRKNAILHDVFNTYVSRLNVSDR